MQSTKYLLRFIKLISNILKNYIARKIHHEHVTDELKFTMFLRRMNDLITRWCKKSIPGSTPPESKPNARSVWTCLGVVWVYVALARCPLNWITIHINSQSLLNKMNGSNWLTRPASVLLGCTQLLQRLANQAQKVQYELIQLISDLVRISRAIFWSFIFR